MISYPGGKGGSGVVQQIINQIPPHRVFISPFFGHCRVTLAKRPAEITIGLDADMDVVAYWESQGLGGCVQHGDALAFLGQYDFKGDEFVYCDPPYLFDVRSSKERIYAAEFGLLDQHVALLALLKTLPCAVAVSGYWSSLYESMLKGWRTISYQTMTRGGTTREEWLWMNYAEPKALHDYRYLGDNFRERELVAKQKRNLLGKLRKLSPLRRYAILAALDEFRSGIAD